MTAILGALAPIFLLILLGHALRRYRLVADAFWTPAEWLTYHLFFPLLLAHNLARAELGGLQVLPMALGLTGAVLLVGAALIATRRHLGLDGPAFTSLFQGSIRPNTYVGLAAASALYGSAGLTLSAIGIAFVVPLVNVLSVLVLARHGNGAAGGFVRVAGDIARNPIILGVGAGALLNLSGLGAPPVLGALMDILGRAALPIGLLAVGAGLDLAAARAAGRSVVHASVNKLLVMPGLTVLTCRLLGVEGLTLTIAVMYNALPCAASAYVLARQMGGDHRLMAGIITAQTLAAALTLPLVLAVFG